jgi:hypothetical protein
MGVASKSLGPVLALEPLDLHVKQGNEIKEIKKQLSFVGR